MKHRTGLLTALAVVVGILLVAGLALAQANATPYTATETPGDIISPGTWTYPDGNTHIRGFVRNYARSASDLRVNGTWRVVMNANLDRNWTGPVWGSARLENGSGVWEGIWQGRFNLATGVGDYESVVIGSGDFRGLQVKEHCVYTGTGTGACTGRILETPGS